MNRWCPSCRKAWPATRNACPDCLVALVDDLEATVACRHCGRTWPSHMHSCPVCLAELSPDPERVADALSAILAAGGHLPRPDHLAPFRHGPACTLRRLSGRGSLVFLGGDGLIEATVDGSAGRATPPLDCRDVDGTVLFRLVRYEPAERAVVAIGADGAPVGTYLRTAGGIDVRDETSAPVAALARARGGFELVETGDGVVATCGTSDFEVDRWIDDRWWLRPGPGVLHLRPLAAVALVLATKVLYGRPWPTPAGEEREPDEWPLG